MAEDDELTIDFGKSIKKAGSYIGNFFKKKEHGESHGHKTKAEAKEVHEHQHQESHEKKNEEAELSIDFRGAWKFIVKNKIVFLILIPLLLSIFFRAYTLYLPVTDQWAQNSVDRYFTAQIMGEINKQYPNLPPENKDAIANENLQKFIAENKDRYEANIQEVSKNFKSQFQNERGHTYLLEIDTWHWFRYARNIVDHGYSGDYIREDGTMMDSHMLAPFGKPVSKEFHPYFGAYLYEFVHFFSPDSDLMSVFFLIPMLLITVAVIPAFFIGRKLGGDLGGLFAGILVAIHPSILSRTIAGFSDTDGYNVMFSLIIFWLFFEALDAKNKKQMLIYSILAGFFTGVFCMAWYGWWYIFDFILASTAVYIIYLVAFDEEKQKSILGVFNFKKESYLNSVVYSLVIFVISTFIFSLLFASFTKFTSFISEPINFITIKESASATLWPNVYTTVAEMNAASISSIVDAVGGKLMFAIGLLGIALTLLRKKDGKVDIKYALLLAVWFAGTIYASTKGIRFTLLLAPALAIAIGAAVGICYKFFSKFLTKELNVNKIVSEGIILLLLLVLLVAPIRGAHQTALNEVPLINDAWYASLDNIRTNSTKDAIINSWWDFGHWFKTIGDRRVTFDGASQNVPQAHWIGRVLLTENEEEAVGMLRMVDCGANRAFDTLNNMTNNTHRSIDILYRIIVLDKDDARALLEKEIPKDKVDSVLQYTHCQAPEDYFITSEDMVGKASVWAHFGSWDFEKAKVWRELRNIPIDKATAIMQKEFGYSKEKAEQLYYDVQAVNSETEANQWIAPWPGYLTSTGCSKANNTVQCVFNMQNQQIPVKVDLTKMEASIETTGGVMHPTSMSYADKSGFHLKQYSNQTIPYSITLIEESEGSYASVMMSPELAGSIFTRLFYLNGTGLDHFDKLSAKTDVTGANIIVWKVDWGGKGR